MRFQGRRRRIGWALVLAVVFALACWAIGVSLVQSLLLFTGFTAVAAVIIALDSFEDEPRLPALDAVGRSEGTRREVSRLSWSMAGADNRVGDAPYRRLRSIALNRLRLRGIEVTEPAGEQTARELLGPLGYAQLIAETAAPPTQRVFQTCLALLEAIDDPKAASPGVSGLSRKPAP